MTWTICVIGPRGSISKFCGAPFGLYSAIATLIKTGREKMRYPITWSWVALLSCAALFVPLASHAAQEYELGAGDTVKITVYNNTDLTTEARIAEDGSIPFPLLGRIALAGQTKAAAEQSISKALIE